MVDRFGAERAFAGQTGPGVIVGDNPFSLVESGELGAIWIRTLPNRPGQIRIAARHSTLGAKVVQIDVQSAKNG